MSALKPIAKNRAFPGVVAVSGAAGRLGQLVVRHLHRTDDLVTIDPRSFPLIPKDVDHLRTELRRRKCRNIFRKQHIQAVVHLGPYHARYLQPDDPDGFTIAIENFSRLLLYCDKYHVKKLILLSSADVYGARSRNPQFLTEEAPLLAADLSALRDVDMMAQSFFWKRPDIETVILRPTHITGGVASVMSQFLRLSPIPRIMGYDPMIQLIHEEDVILGIRRALAPGLRGIFNLAGPPPLPLSHIIRKLGAKSVPIPHFLAKPVLAQLYRLGRLNLLPAYIDYIRYVCMVDDTRAQKEMGYRPAHNLEDTINAVNIWE